MSRLLTCCLLFAYASSYAQTDSSQVMQKRLRLLNIGVPVTYASSFVGLYTLWYKDYPMGKFHFFNDNNEWQQMDKVGHSYSAYQLSRTSTELYRWAGLKGKKAVITGGLVGYSYLTTIEILDGFSTNWGASLGDLAANTFGTGLYIGQELLWEEQRFSFKFSFAPTSYAAIRPNTLGDNFFQQYFKDYNGQTYWLSANIKSLALKKTSKFPGWLNLALGYGATGMVGAEQNKFTETGQTVVQDYTYISRQRQWYLAPDIDFTRIPCKSKWGKRALFVLNCWKFPAPTLSSSGNKLKFNYLYF